MTLTAIKRQLAKARAQGKTPNLTGYGLACILRDSGLDKDTARLYMLEYARTGPHPEGKGYTESDALASLEAAYAYPQRRIAQ